MKSESATTLLSLTTLEALERRWPGAFAIPLSVVAEAFATTPQTAHNLLSLKKLKFPVVKFGSRPLVMLVDLAAHLDAQRGLTEATSPRRPQDKRGPGRPRKYPHPRLAKTKTQKTPAENEAQS